jgi:hypothetical protein
LTTDAAIRLNTVMGDPLHFPRARRAARSPPQEAWSNPKTIES